MKVDLTHQTLRRGDTLIICSDGLSGLVRAGGVRRHGGGSTPELSDLCGALIDLANERGGPDNITVVAAHFEGDGLPEPSEAEDVGYAVYHLPDGDGRGRDPPTVPTVPAAAAAPAADPARQPRRARCCSWPRCSA